MIHGVGILSVETTMTPYLDELFAQECEEELIGQGTLESFTVSLEDIGKLREVSDKGEGKPQN